MIERNTILPYIEIVTSRVLIDIRVNYLEKNIAEQQSLKSSEINIYSGLSGKVLYLIKSGSLVNQSECKNVIVAAGNLLTQVVDTEQESDPSLMYGQAGIAYTLACITGFTGDYAFIKRSFEILNKIDSILEDRCRNYSFFSGIAGILWVAHNVLMIYQTPQLINLIKKCISICINGIDIRDCGIAWNSETTCIKPICSFGHGNSGIAYVFNLLGSFYNADGLLFIGRNALSYEDSKWSSESNNWPDYRKKLFSYEDYKTFFLNYKLNNQDFFTSPDFNQTFESGSAGIIYSHMNSGNRSINRELRNHIDSALDHLNYSVSNANYSKDNLSLFKGLAGSIVCLGKASSNGFGEYHGTITSSLKVIFNQLNVSGFNEDTSISGGLSGIGYMLILCYTEFKTDLLLTPCLQKTDPNLKNSFILKEYSIFNILTKLIKKKLPRTTKSLERFNHELIYQYLCNYSKVSNTKIYETFRSFLERKYHDMSLHEKTVIDDIFSLEFFKIRLQVNCKSLAYLSIHQIQKDRFAQSIDFANRTIIAEKDLIIDHNYVHFYETEYDWSAPDILQFYDTESIQEGSICHHLQNVLLIQRPSGVEEINLTQLQYFLLSLFIDKTKVSAGVHSFVLQISEHHNDKTNVLIEIAYSNIQRFIFSGVFIECH
jgi:hypothetical protein